MEGNQQTTPVVAIGSHNVVIKDAKEIAGMFGKAIEDADSARKRSESQLASFYDAIVNSADHLAGWIKRPTAKEKEKLPVIDGKPRPLVVASLIQDQGYMPDTAETMFSNMIRLREAYTLLKYVPTVGTPWNVAVKEAGSAIGVKTRQTRKAKVDNEKGALQASYVAQAVQRLSPEDRKDPAKGGATRLEGLADADRAARDKRINLAANDAWQAIGGAENVEAFIAEMRKRLTDWQTKQSTQQPAGETPAATQQPQGVQAPTEPARQAA